MTGLMRVLRYEFSIPVWEILVIVALVLAINAAWGHAPWWVFALAGVALAAAESAWDRRRKKPAHD